MFFILPTWQYDCQFYPSLVCPINAAGDIPFLAILARLGAALGVGAVAAGAFYVVLGRGRRRDADAG